MNRNRLLLCVATFFFWFSQYAYVPYFTPKLGALQAAAGLVGAMSALYGLSQLLLRIPLGVAADRLGRHKIFILCGLSCSMLAAGGMAVASSPYTMGALRLLSGVAASTWASFTVLFAGLYRQEESVRAMAMLNVFNFGGRFASSALSGAASNVTGSMDSAFWLSAAAALVGLFLAVLVVERRSRREPMKLLDMLSFHREKGLLVASLLAMLCQVVAYSTGYSFVSDYAVSMGAGQDVLGYLTAVFILPCIAASYLSGTRFMQRRKSSNVIMGGFLLFLVYCALLSAARGIGHLYLAQLLGGCGNGLLFTTLMGLSCRDVDPAKKTAAMGFYQAMYALGMTIGPLVMGGLLQSFGFRPGFVALAVLSAVGAVLAKWLYGLRERA